MQSQKILGAVLNQGLACFDKNSMRELESFVRRNLFTFVYTKNGKKFRTHTICARCFKAYLITKAEEMHTDAEVVKDLLKNVECGHDGYYLDGGELKKAPR